MAKPPTTIDGSSVLVAIAARAISTPIAAGAATAKRISSSDQATGWRTLMTTAAAVSAIMIKTNGRLPRPPPWGTTSARWPSTAGQRDEPEDRQQPAQRAPDEDQQPDPADRVERDPLRGERQPQAHADERHHDPERASPAPVAGPERRRTACRPRR